MPQAQQPDHPEALPLPPDAAVPLPVQQADATAPAWHMELPDIEDDRPEDRGVAAHPLVEPLETWQPRVGGIPLDEQQDSPEALLGPPADLGVTPPVRPAAARSHRQWQRPLDVGQGSRGTCWAFAGVAALEAAYARRGVQVDLSEQYLFHVMKAHEAHANRTAFTSLIGFMGSADIVQNLTYAAVPESRHAPYHDQPVLLALAAAIPQTGGVLGPVVAGTLEQSDWFEYDLRLVPLMARWFAQYRVRSFTTLVNYTVNDVKKAIDAGYDVVVDVFDRINNGGHAIVIFGYDDATSSFEIKNSQSTVNGGFATMAYSNDRQFTLQNGQAFCITDVWPVQTQWSAMWLGRWEIDHDGWRGRLVVRRFCDLRSGRTEVGPQNRVSIGTWYGEDGRVLDVVGHFVDGGRGLHCAIGGQPFELYLHTRDPYRASGRCHWNGMWFGVVLSRGTATGAGSGFHRSETIGLWDTTHDGWRGQFRIGVDPSYVEAASGTVRSARIDPSPVAHEVVSHVAFGGGEQRFQLLAHTREDGVLAGVTQWGGKDWPVEGRMSRNLYTVRADGTLWWYRHPGRFRLDSEWDPPRHVGTGWQGLPAIIGGGDGVVYTVRSDGALAWYFHDGRNQGTFDWQGPTVVGSGWGGFRSVFAGDGGVIYAITTDGRLLWYRHLGRRDGSAAWVGPIQVGTGWDIFTTVAAGPDGTIYGVRPDGALLWYRHYGHDQGFPIWHGPLLVGSGWDRFDAIWPVGQGYVYARVGTRRFIDPIRGAGDTASDVEVSARTVGRTGDLLLFRHHGFLIGDQSWGYAGVVGTGWGRPIRAVFAT